MKTTFNLEPIQVLITGSSKGIGRAIADYFKHSGAGVVYHGSSIEHRPEQIPAQDYLSVDLLDDAGPAQLVDDAFSLRPGLNTLIANAGSFFDTPFLEMEQSVFQKTMRLNLEATFLACQRFAQRLVELKRSGSIIIISSTNAFQAEDNSVAYDTSKGGLYMMTRSLAVSLADKNIRVNGVAPGLIRTPLTESHLVKNPELVAHYQRKILTGRIGNAEDCAGACAFLASDAASYVTGHVIVVDGGLTVGQIGRMA